MSCGYFTVFFFFDLVANGLSSDPLNKGPSFLSEPPNRVEFSNSSGTVIPCLTDGRPRPVVTWVKNDGEVVHDLTGLRYIRHDGSLVFPPFAAEDYRSDVHASIYRCEVSNSMGIIGSRDVHVRAVVMQHYEIRLFDEFVLRGNMAILRCPIPSSVSDYVRVVSWERIDGFTITTSTLNDKYGMLENGDLYLIDTTDHVNTFSFRCHTENILTREKKMSTNYSRIIITDPHHAQPPRIVQRSNIVTAAIGQKTTLSCVAQGHPIPRYRWHKLIGNQPVSLQMSSTARQDGGVLVFHKTVSSDSGRYVCHVSNSMGEDSVQIELIIEDPLQVSLVPKELQTDVGRTATFHCNVSGNPVGSVVWKKDMRSLSPSNSRVIFSNQYVIQLRQLKRTDSGMYQCFVYRDSTSAQSYSRLIIGDLAPKFKTVFIEKTVRSGSFVSLVCTATGNPEPHIRWKLDGIWPVMTRPGILVSSYLSAESVVTSYVNFTSIDIIDSGAYSCEAINDAGSAQHSKRLNVFGPLFIRPLDNLTALAGANFEMICPFGGYPYDTISWKKDGRTLPINQRQRIYPNGTFQIVEVHPGEDNGQYSCEVASNQGIMPPASRSFRIVVRAGPKIAGFSFKENLHEGMRTVATCIVLGGDGPLVAKWLKDGRPISEQELDVNILQEDDGSISILTFKNLTHRHNGNYSCVVSNDVASESSSATLTVKVPPKWILQPADISTVAGRPAQIDCQADGVPQPHVRWKMAINQLPEQFKTIVSSSHIHILVNGSLNFRSVEASDAGYYLCEANNGVGSALSAIVRLTVHSAPHFMTKFLVITARRGEKTVIECAPEGDQPMSFTWRKNGALLDLTKETRYSQTSETIGNGEKSILTIEKAERRDSALITCTATNNFGEDSVNIQVTVQDIPDAPQNLEVYDVASRSVRLTWKRPFDGNFPITRYTIMWRRIDDEFIGGPLHVPGSETTLIIRGLKPNTRYFFRVKCENALGESQFGAEVAITTMEEPPSVAPQYVKATPITSKAINITWQIPKDEATSIDGFYVGYRMRTSTDPFTFKPVQLSNRGIQHFEIGNLNRYTEYTVVVQAYNGRGAGPPSEEAYVRTLEFDPPNVPIMRTYFATSKTLKLSWEPRINANAPISGYILHHKMENSQWQETHLTGDRSTYTLHDLQCGTTYSFYLVAFNSVGKGNASETMTAKTDGGPPRAPDKRLLLSANSSAVNINLNSWHNGGCPINFFIIQYRPNGQQEWTLVSNNVIPEQNNITITDLSPGSWYSMLMTAKNDAGSTDAEYIFATLMLSGDYPPRPSKINDISGSFYRHLTITVPVVSSVIVLAVVFCAVCFINKHRSSGNVQRAPNESECREPVKGENVPLSVTYDGTHDPTYLPTPYATSRVAGYGREHCVMQGAENQQIVGTFGSTRSGFTYSVPQPSRQVEKSECIYESPVIYFSGYRHIEIRTRTDHPIYEVPDINRRKIHSTSRSWRESGDGDSSTGSENEDLLYTHHSPGERIIQDPRESETECDRLWKNFESCEYESSKQWTDEHVVLA